MNKEELEDFLAKIDNEGFAYFFTAYASPDENTEKELSDLWIKFQEAHNALESHLEGLCEKHDLELYG